ncbi:MAG: PEGA domain-containing protein [Fibrobacter sp.]|nr:PEGA domain-containing protein [Fibrobacter sp.]
MKLRLLTLLHLLLLVSLVSAAVSDPFTINRFKSSNRILPLSSNDIIKSEAGRTCTEIDSVITIAPGNIVMRKKIDGGEYRLYEGSIDTNAFKREPPLYAFRIPANRDASGFIRKRIYSSIEQNHSNDIEEVYFDEFNFYVRHHGTVFVNIDRSWITLQGSRSYPHGRFELVSEPDDAQIVINGISTLRKTPCSIERVASGKYTIELFLPNHHFSRNEVYVRPDSTVKLSFELLSDFDTVYISGDNPYGLLYFPSPPVDTPFVIDTLRTHNLKAELLDGSYRIQWNGGNRYESIDTILTITAGKVCWFDKQFVRKKGILSIRTLPFDAEVCIDTLGCSFGDRTLELQSGNYTVDISRHGFVNTRKIITVLPDTINNYVVDLRMNADLDADGYLDSIDRCPDIYGLYDGCPKQSMGRAVAVKKNEIVNYIKNDQLTIGSSLIGFIARIPSNRKFSSFLSTFSSGRIGGVNNYRGLTMFNTYHVMYRGIYGGVELGQWSSGIRYKDSDTLHLKSDSGNYVVFYDSLRGIKPAIYLPSTSLSLGFHYNFSWINVIYSLGYQWEDIVIDQIYNRNSGTLEQFTYNNDWWFHQIHLEADFHADRHFVPSVYFNMKFPFGNYHRTRWHSINVGLKVKIYPFGYRKPQQHFDTKVESDSQ